MALTSFQLKLVYASRTEDLEFTAPTEDAAVRAVAVRFPGIQKIICNGRTYEVEK